MSQQKQINAFHRKYPSSVNILKEQLRNQNDSNTTEEEIDMLVDNELWSFFSTATRQDVNSAGVACVIDKASKVKDIRNFGGLVNTMLKKDWVHNRFAIGNGDTQITTSTVTNDFEELPETAAPKAKTRKKGGSKRRERLEGIVSTNIKSKVKDLADTIGKTQAELTGELIERGLDNWLQQVNR